jgi:site-specific recombinase XerD
VIGIGPTEANLDLVEGFNQWLTVQNYSASTRINYCTDVRGLACFAARSSLLEIERRQVVEYMRFLKEFRNLAAASIARTIFSLRKFYKFLTLGEIVSPCSNAHHFIAESPNTASPSTQQRPN